MANGRLTKGERTREALVAAAIDRFARSSYQRVALGDIARDAGVSPTAVYRYFEDKLALFVAAVDSDAEALVEFARARLDLGDGVPSLADLLDLMSEGLADAVIDHPLVSRVLAGDPTMPPRQVLDLPSLAALRVEIASLLQALQQQGAVRASLDPAVAALALETVVIDHLADLTTGGSGDADTPADDRWHAVVTLLRVALRPEPLPGAAGTRL
ncbi:MAG: TetR/AcrR family transcriptional regulator [Actinomycetota bacterium]|nr:TetR/AcrR family transcriptional regulator [Actinomycetota bacterium]